MKKGVSLILVFIVLMTGVGCQQSRPELQATAYHPNKDIYIMFNGFIFRKVTSFLPLDVLGEIAFRLQEGTHESIKDVSQAEIDRYYIWVCLADECIPVDPFTYSK
jgi:hypothetical protein